MPTDASRRPRGRSLEFLPPARPAILRWGWAVGLVACSLPFTLAVLGSDDTLSFSSAGLSSFRFGFGGEGADAAPVALAVEERWATRGDPGTAEFGVIAGMAEAANGEVWISDGMRREIFAVDRAGGRLRKVSGTGEGPGEVGAPGPIAAYPGGGLAVYDVLRGVQVFGRDGGFARRVPLPDLLYNVKGFVALPNGGFVLSGGVQGKPHALHRYSADGRRDGAWYPVPATRDPQAGLMVAGGPLSLARDGALVFSQAAPHRVLRFPARGGAPRVIAADSRLLSPVGDDFIQEKDGWRTFRWHFPQSRAVFARPDGTVLNVVRKADADSTIWELYRGDGRLLARQRVNRAYEPWTMTRDGDVLASYRHPETDETVATRLRLTLR